MQSVDAGGYIDVFWDPTAWKALPASTMAGCPDAVLSAILNDSAGNLVASKTATANVCSDSKPTIHFVSEIGSGGFFQVTTSATVNGSAYPAVLTVSRPVMTVYGATIAVFNGQYMSADNDGGSTVSTTLTDSPSAAQWIIQDLDGGYLQSGDLVRIAHNSGIDGSFWYGSAESGGGAGSVFHINRTAAGGWETFTIGGSSATEPPGTVAQPNVDSTSINTTFLSSGGSYMSAEWGGGVSGDGSVTVDRTVAGGWEWFTVKLTEPCTQGDDGFPLAPYCAPSQACNSTTGCYVACTSTSCASNLRCVPSIGCVPPLCTPDSCSQFQTCDPNAGCLFDPSKVSQFNCSSSASYANTAFCRYTYLGVTTPGIARVTDTPTVASMLDRVAQGYPDKVGGPRNLAIALALQQVPRDTPINTPAGKCDSDAVDFYSPNQGIFKDDEWCSEFVRDMALWSGAVQNLSRCTWDTFLGCLASTSVSDITKVDDWRDMFTAYGGWHSPFTPQLVQPGDYIAMVNSEGQPNGHSEMVIAISADNGTLWTMSGNYSSGSGPHCVAFAQQSFVTAGGATGYVVSSNLNSTGDLSVLF